MTPPKIDQLTPGGMYVRPFTPEDLDEIVTMEHSAKPREALCVELLYANAYWRYIVAAVLKDQLPEQRNIDAFVQQLQVTS